MQFHEEHGEGFPAGWSKGDKGMDDFSVVVAAYLSENSDER